MSDTGNQDLTPQEREYTAIEQEAMSQGWRPKEEFEGDEGKFIDAGEFIRRGELFSKIDHQSKEIKQLRNAMEQFKSHHANVEKVAYDRAIKDLKAQRKAALAEGDVDKFDELDQAIEDVTQERDDFIQKQAQQPAVAPSVDPAFTNWVAKNPWYQNDAIMQGAADRLGLKLAREGLAPLEVLKKVEQEIKKEFAHKFSNPNRDKPSAVEASTPRGTGAKSKFVPSEMEKRIGANLVRAGAFAKIEDYYAELDQMNKGN